MVFDSFNMNIPSLHTCFEKKRSARGAESVRREKWNNRSRYLSKYGHLHPKLETAERYQYDGLYSLHKAQPFERLYNVENGYVVEDGWLPKKVYRSVLGDQHQEVNPTIIAQAALLHFNNAIEFGHSFDPFLKLADLLVEIIKKDGSVRYEFNWYYYLSQVEFESGWVSAMAQGQCISVLVRAHGVTQDARFLEYAKLLFEFMNKSVAKGGTRGDLADLHPDLSGFPSFEEYVSSPNNFTLNGWVYALLGVYDLMCAWPESQYKQMLNRVFSHHIASLSTILPLYDFDGLSCYDLGYITFDAPPNFNLGYHETHIRQLRILGKLSGHALFFDYANVWQDFLTGEV